MNLFGNAKASAAQATELAELRAMVAAIQRSQGTIEFNLDGTVITANDNFLRVLGYSLEEVRGRPHSMFVSPEFAASDAYRAFWRRLNNGEFVADKFERIGKGGRRVWIQASYNPMVDAQGRPYKVVKFATDITAVEAEQARQKAELADAADQTAHVCNALAAGLSALAEGDLLNSQTKCNTLYRGCWHGKTLRTAVV